MSDMFDLSSWVSDMVTMLDLKICDKNEWKVFNDHYNQETGEITAHKPYETINTTLDTTMSIVDRDELSNVHIELAMAHTTIRGLSEAVVNFSCTGKVSTYQQDEVVKKHQTNPAPAPALCWVKSANPEVIKPTHNTTLKLAQPMLNTLLKPKANPHQLIFQFNPPILETK